MKIKFLKEWARTFVFIFGILQMVLAVSSLFPPNGYWGWGLNNTIFLDQIVTMLFVSAVLTTCYFVITSDPVTSRRALILRLVGCSIPFALVAYILTYAFEFHSLFLNNLDVFYEPLIPTRTRLMLQSIAVYASIVLYFIILLLISLRHQKQAKHYNAALETYKNAEE